MMREAARDYQHWEIQRKFWRRVSITCAALALFFAGVSVGLVIS